MKSTSENKQPVIHRFKLIVHPTYYDMGFFNVVVDHARFFGDHGQALVVHVKERHQPINASINRRANRNATPRIMGRAPLRQWFHENAGVMEAIIVEVHSPVSIAIRVKDL